MVRGLVGEGGPGEGCGCLEVAERCGEVGALEMIFADGLGHLESLFSQL